MRGENDRMRVLVFGLITTLLFGVQQIDCDAESTFGTIPPIANLMRLWPPYRLVTDSLYEFSMAPLQSQPESKHRNLSWASSLKTAWLETGFRLLKI